MRPIPVCAALLAIATAASGQVARVSVDSSGNEANAASGASSLSADGRFVAFESGASNLVASDDNAASDVFVFDRIAKTTACVSVDASGHVGHGGALGSTRPALSGSGRFVAFQSDADDLVPGDGNGVSDVFVRDRFTGVTERVSVDSLGNEADADSGSCAISADGGVVAFASAATNLVPGYSGSTLVLQLYVHVRATGATEIVSVDPFGAEGDGSTFNPSLSSDGHVVVFTSGSTNLIAGGTQPLDHVYARNRWSYTTELVSVATGGAQGDGASDGARSSPDGNLVVFESAATNLVAGDTNLHWDVFIRDRAAATTACVSVDPAGVPGDGDSSSPDISRNGRDVAFRTEASNLVSGNPNGGLGQIVVRDLSTAVTAAVSVDASGNWADAGSDLPGLSGDGSVVAFTSVATNLAAADTNGVADVFASFTPDGGPTTGVTSDPRRGEADAYSVDCAISGDSNVVAFSSYADNLVFGDTNTTEDVFAYDRRTGVVTCVSFAPDGTMGLGEAFGPSVSEDGRYVCFCSRDANLVANDNNFLIDVFVHDIVTGVTERVSVDPTGGDANGDSDDARISADGNFVAFTSSATNLVSGFGGGKQIYRFDRTTKTTIAISVSGAGVQANAWSTYPAISADGHCVAFSSGANNLVPGDTNNQFDVFVRDVANGTTELASVSSSGAQANGGSAWDWKVSISGDGNRVAFSSYATNLAPGDKNGYPDIFVHDRALGTTVCASVDSAGNHGNYVAEKAELSGDGNFVAFASQATNLVPGDTNGYRDVFVHNLAAATTVRVSLANDGSQGNFESYLPAISRDGSGVAFMTSASNLIPGDTNGSIDVLLRQQHVGAWFLYGNGAPGSNGVPSLALSANPVLGTTVDLDIGNSAGASTFGLILAGGSSTDILLGCGAHVLVAPLLFIPVSIPSSGLSIPFSIPNDPTLAGLPFFLQVGMLDPGAKANKAFTQGLQMNLGF